MITKPNRAILRVAIDWYGEPNQLIKTSEELAELIKEIAKSFSYKTDAEGKPGNLNCIAEEAADALIMIEQLSMIFDLDNQINGFIDHKQERILRRVADEKRELRKKGMMEDDEIYR